MVETLNRDVKLNIIYLLVICIGFLGHVLKIKQ